MSEDFNEPGDMEMLEAQLAVRKSAREFYDKMCDFQNEHGLSCFNANAKGVWQSMDNALCEFIGQNKP